MSIWNKVLVGLILLTSVAFFCLGARALKTHQYWRTQVAQHEEELATALDEQAGLVDEIRQLSVDLHEQLVDRGRVWYGCRPQPGPDAAQTGEVVVKVEFPDPHQIAPQTVLSVFDELPVENGGRYLGQFVVVGLADNIDVQLKPSTKMTDAERTRLDQSAKRDGATWSLYEVMPTDNHDALAGLDQEQLKALLPKASVEEYVTDGKLTTLEDVKQRGLRGKVFKVDQTGQIVKKDGLEQEVQAENEKGKYVRQLRDYGVLFRVYELQRTEAIDREKSLTRNVDYITRAHDEAKLQLQYRQKERDQLVIDRDKYFGERDLASAHLKAVQGKLAAIRTAVLETIKTNQAMAGEIARIQREATRIIDEQTRRMARASAGN